MGSGNCSFWAPGVFDLNDDGIAIVLTRRPRPTTRSCSLRRAAHEAIAVFDGDAKLVLTRPESTPRAPRFPPCGGCSFSW